MLMRSAGGRDSDRDGGEGGTFALSKYWTTTFLF